MPAFKTQGTVALDDPEGLPRFDAHLASLLADPKHLNNELGMQLQAYIEGCPRPKVRAAPRVAFPKTPKEAREREARVRGVKRAPKALR